MSTNRKHFAAAAVLALAGIAAFAQPAPAPAQGQRHEMARGDHGRNPQMMQEHMARRQAEMKARLQITPAQEAAWNNFTQAMRPTGARPQRPNFVEFARMTTPQRIDKMRELRTQRNAEMDRRAEATKAFYAQLSPAQQKLFDEQSFGMFGGRGHGHGRGHHHDGYDGRKG